MIFAPLGTPPAAFVIRAFSFRLRANRSWAERARCRMGCLSLTFRGNLSHSDVFPNRSTYNKKIIPRKHSLGGFPRRRPFDLGLKRGSRPFRCQVRVSQRV